MTNLEFFKIVKANLKDYFFSNGFPDCKIYKGRRNSICFEKKVEYYTVDIVFHWQSFDEENSLRGFDFAIEALSLHLLPESEKTQKWLWTFKTEEELVNLLKLVPKKIEEQNFLKQVDEINYWYFHRKNIP